MDVENTFQEVHVHCAPSPVRWLMCSPLGVASGMSALTSHGGGGGQRAAPSQPLAHHLLPAWSPVQGVPFLGDPPIAEEDSAGAPCGCIPMEGPAPAGSVNLPSTQHYLWSLWGQPPHPPENAGKGLWERCLLFQGTDSAWTW